MTEPLFSQMDEYADRLRASRHDLHDGLCDDLRRLFHEVQQARMPELTPEQSADLFTVWVNGFLGRRMAESEARVAAIVKAIDASGGREGRPVRCPGCGHIICGPDDPFSLLQHGLHIELGIAAASALLHRLGLA